MNLYFLLEGRRTEKRFYPKLIEFLQPHFKQVQFSDDAKENNYYLISGEGFPSVCDNALPKAIEEVEDLGIFDYLILVLDTDNNEIIRERIEYIKINTQLKNCQFLIIEQEICIESWLLGNRAVYPKDNAEFVGFELFYNVAIQDPERMLKPDNFTGSLPAYHHDYLKKMLAINGINYSKKLTGGVTTPEYFAELQKRINETSHLASLKNFFSFCESISI